jgi:HD-like signal output (HDOD) protein
MIGALRRLFDPKERLRHALLKQPVPTLPTGPMRVLTALRSDAALPTIGQLIGQDPALTAALLRTVNSAAFGLKKRVASPGHAASLLGRSALESMVLSIAAAKAMPTEGFDHVTFWRLSARRAATARALADLVSPRSRHTCFSGALLQDIALPLLIRARPDAYKPMLASSQSGEAMAAFERETFGFEHAEVAGWLAEDWRFPEDLIAAIQTHHQSEDGPVPVQIAGLVHDLEDELDGVVDLASERFNLSPDVILQALTAGREEGDDLARALTR